MHLKELKGRMRSLAKSIEIKHTRPIDAFAWYHAN